MQNPIIDMNLVIKTFDELTPSQVYEILKARAAIFVVEQNCVYQDMDDIDYQSLHIFYEENNKVVAYLRAFNSEPNVVKIGRVLTLVHGKGLGGKLLKSALAVIPKRLPCHKIICDAQCHALGFYEKAGFKVVSDTFLEDNLPHKKMELTVK